MTWMIPRRWRGLALAAPAVTALLVVPLASQAREPVTTPQEIQRESGGNPTGSGPNTVVDPFTPSSLGNMSVGPQGTSAGMPVRKVTPDEDRMRELTGQVVKLNGMVLYVETSLGAVVPLDVSALRLREAPEKGEKVVAVYQVENTVENVALSLAKG
ncbi:hypothetical protein ACLESO_39210 [Pyxidicoccus sp. 3LG]